MVIIAKIYDILNIDFSQEIIDIITAVQNDTKSRYLDINLFDDGIPIDLSGHEVRIYARKPDKLEIFNDGKITNATAGRCQFELTSQLLGTVGVVKAEISVWKDNIEILTTPTFNILVTECLRTNGSIESSNEYGALVVLFQKLYEAYDLMIEMVQNIGKPSEETIETGINTMWQAWEKIIADTKTNTTIITNSITSNIKKILDLIGTTSQTGATATSGTLFSKLNKLLSDWNTDRANKVDNIYNFTKTSSNSNSNGILSEKLNYIINKITLLQGGTGKTLNINQQIVAPEKPSFSESSNPYYNKKISETVVEIQGEGFIENLIFTANNTFSFNYSSRFWKNWQVTLIIDETVEITSFGTKNENALILPLLYSFDNSNYSLTTTTSSNLTGTNLIIAKDRLFFKKSLKIMIDFIFYQKEEVTNNTEVNCKLLICYKD